MNLLSLLLDGKPLGAEITLRPTIRLDVALLCGDCSSIFEAEGEQQCPSCGSKEAMSLGRALNRTAQEKRAKTAAPKVLPLWRAG